MTRETILAWKIKTLGLEKKPEPWKFEKPTLNEADEYDVRSLNQVV